MNLSGPQICMCCGRICDSVVTYIRPSKDSQHYDLWCVDELVLCNSCMNEWHTHFPPHADVPMSVKDRDRMLQNAYKWMFDKVKHQQQHPYDKPYVVYVNASSHGCSGWLDDSTDVVCFSHVMGGAMAFATKEDALAAYKDRLSKIRKIVEEVYATPPKPNAHRTSVKEEMSRYKCFILKKEED